MPTYTQYSTASLPADSVGIREPPAAGQAVREEQQVAYAIQVKPWRDADPAVKRLSPENGLPLNALHDRAFDKGLIRRPRAARGRLAQDAEGL